MATTAGHAHAHRDVELAVVDTAWADLTAGRPALLAIEGPRGIGKSALLAAALRRLPTPRVVLQAQCTDGEREHPFGVVEQLFDGTQREPRAPRRSPSPGVLQGYLQTARDLSANTPVVVAIDDIQHADGASLEWFSYVTRRLDHQLMAAVVTVEGGTREAQLVERMVDDAGSAYFAAVLRPEPLCDSCTENVAAGLLDSALDTELAVACHELSRGNPLVLREFVSRLQEAGISPGSPDLGAVFAIGAATLADTSLTWLQHRHPGAAALLASVAVLGSGTDPSTAAALAGQADLAAVEALAVLRDAGLVHPGNGPVRLGSAMVGAAALSRMSPADRTAMHAGAARLLTRSGLSARQAADHLMVIGPATREWAVPVLRSAAREAVRATDGDAAVRYLRRAAAESESGPAALALEIGCLELHRDVPSAVRCIETAVSVLPDLTDRARALATVVSPVLLSEGAAALAPFVDVVTRLSAGAGAVPGEYLGLAAVTALAGHRFALTGWVRSLTPVGGKEPVRAGSERAMLGSLAATTGAGGRHRTRAVCLARRSAAGGVDAGVSMIGAVVLARWAEEFDDAATWATWMVDAARVRQHRGELALALVGRASVSFSVGRLDTALDDAREAAALAEQVRAGGLRAAAAVAAARVLLERGDLDRADAVLTAARPSVEDHALLRASALAARGALAAARGQHRAALRAYQESGHTLSAGGLTNPAAVSWRSGAVAALVALSDPAAAGAVARDDVRSTARWGSPGARGRALVSLSLVESGEEALGTAAAGVALLHGSGMRREHAAACALLAGLHRSAGDGVSADLVLSRCAAATASGPSAEVPDPAPGRPVDALPGRLTVSEGRVTDLVLQGMTNQEVADTLSISRRTVDTHLNRVYRKLGISSRNDLARVLETGSG